MTYPELISSPEALGSVLRQARRLNGLSQRELARRLGTSQRYIWELEAGKHSIFVDRLFALLGLTGTSLIAILDPEHAARSARGDDGSFLTQK
ncbi:helix-turn-helix domain-containing protein [Microlunatus sp. GCM10028923]|uniref:helix-turn-helix domain-containing protein n=1 Tax=Microlunatus sp. GCM10028923 TaxID=3273400 RepID=UPI00360CAFA5